MNILITTGPTREFIDPVRFISSPSTGTIGVFLAREFLCNKENKITIISGPTDVKFPSGSKSYRVVSAVDMYNLVKKIYRKFDVIIMASSVSDFRPMIKYKSKLKKTQKNVLNIKLVKNPDILQYLSKHITLRQVLVGFSLESNNLLENSMQKFSTKKVDLIVANKLPAFGTQKVSGYLIYNQTAEKFTNVSKKQLARKIKDLIYQFINNRKYT